MKIWPRNDDVPESEGRLAFEFIGIAMLIGAICIGAWLL
jgi:hypothetical protein